MADTVSVTQAVLLRAFKLVDGIAGEINGVPNEPTGDMADDIAMDLAEALGVPFDEHWPEAAAESLASTQPAPAFPREEVAKADLFQAIHDAMRDEINGVEDGDIIVKGCEAAGYCDPESAADAFKAAAADAIAALLERSGG